MEGGCGLYPGLFDRAYSVAACAQYLKQQQLSFSFLGPFAPRRVGASSCVLHIRVHHVIQRECAALQQEQHTVDCRQRHIIGQRVRCVRAAGIAWVSCPVGLKVLGCDLGFWVVTAGVTETSMCSKTTAGRCAVVFGSTACWSAMPARLHHCAGMFHFEMGCRTGSRVGTFGAQDAHKRTCGLSRAVLAAACADAPSS